jgi:cobalt-zinc-cadmium resistance protein CzcA
LINAEIKGKELQSEISVLELKNQVRTYYYQIQYLQHNQKQLQYLDSLYNDFIK